MYCPEHQEECGVALDRESPALQLLLGGAAGAMGGSLTLGCAPAVAGAVLRSLDLFRLPYLVGTGGSGSSSSDGGSSSSTGAIVAGVLVGNGVSLLLFIINQDQL